MKKFVKALVLIFMVSIFMLSGCNLVQINTARYFDRVVATVNGLNITKRELISAYNSYGYQFVNYYGYTTEKAVDETIKYLVNRKLITEYVKDEMASSQTNLTIAQQNDIWRSVFDSVNSQLLTIENTIRKELNMEAISTDEDKKDSDYPVETVYEKKVVKDGDNFVKVQTNDEEETELLTKANFAKKLYGDVTVSDSAWARYIKVLIKSEEGKGLDTIEANVFSRELDRLHSIYEEDKYYSLLEEMYNKNFPVTVETIDSVVSKYKELVLASYNKYEELGSEAGYTQYVKDMQADSSKVYYHPYGEKFTQVAHILIKFTDEQLTALAKIKDDYAKGIIGTPAEYDQALTDWKAGVRIKARDAEGNETGDELTLQQVYDEIKSTLDALGNDVQAKAEAFNKLIYKYGQDTGMFNASKYYVVNLDTTQTDTMVKAFADESRRLYNEEGNGSLSSPIFVDNTGSSNAYAGFHIIFNVGGVDNVMVSNISNINNITAEELYNTRIMLGTSKTYFDAMYDLVYKSSYSNRQTSLITQLRADSTIVYFVDAYKDLY